MSNSPEQLMSNERSEDGISETLIDKITSKSIELYIDAESKARSGKYLATSLMKDQQTCNSSIKLIKTLASIYDSAADGNIGTTMKICTDQIKENEHTFEIKCGSFKLIKIKFTAERDSKNDINDVTVEITNWFGIPKTSWKSNTKKDSELNEAYTHFVKKDGGEGEEFKWLLFKSIGDLGQILYFSNTDDIETSSLKIFHTIDHWCAGIAALFGNIVICENSVDRLMIDRENLYAYFNNIFYVTYQEKKYLEDKPLQGYKPSENSPLELLMNFWRNNDDQVGQTDQTSQISQINQTGQTGQFGNGRLKNKTLKKHHKNKSNKRRHRRKLGSRFRIKKKTKKRR